MRWFAVALPVAFMWLEVWVARAVALSMFALFFSTQSFAGEVWKVHPDSLEISYGLRIGSCSGPAAYSHSESRVLEPRLSLIGIQITLQQGNVGQIGAGMDLMIGPRFQTSGDSLLYDSEHIRYSAIFLYVSPGIHVRLGRDQPLRLGASVDIGPLWSRETSSSTWWGSNREYLAVERTLAIRPKFLLSYNLTHSLQFQFEYGWMHGKIRPAYYLDYPDRYWYVELPRDFDGPYFVTSLTITRPVKRKAITVVKQYSSVGGHTVPTTIF